MSQKGKLLRRVESSRSEEFHATLQQAQALHQRGEFLEAERLYEEALTAQPDNFDALHLLALVTFQTGRPQRGLALIEKAISLNPSSAEAYVNRGGGLKALGRFNEAAASYGRAIALKPDYAHAYYNRAAVLYGLQQFDAAIADFDKAIELNPAFPPAYNQRAIALAAKKSFEDAIVSWNKAIALRPDFADAYANKGVALIELARFDEALASLEKAIALDPRHAYAYNSRGVALKELSRLTDAIAQYDRAIALVPNHRWAHYNRGNAFREVGDMKEATKSYKRALALKPDYADAKLGLCMAQLPIIYADEGEIDERRATYRKHLQALYDESETAPPSDGMAAAIGSSQPFFLAYQGRNDRDLQELYGAFVRRVIARQHPDGDLARPPETDEPLRIGFISGFFRQHSNWKVPIKGWLSQIDRKRFRIYGYHTSARQDAATGEAAALCDHFVQGPLSLGKWRQTILDDRLHALIYPEVGMDPVCGQLAALRLAPVQCGSWGHPQTSGMPTIDYYLSSELMEPPDAAQHYTERLVRLPNLSVYYEPVAVAPAAMSRAAIGLRESACVFWSGQSLYKYLPQFDGVFAKIAALARDCQFIFLRHPTSSKATELFRVRLERAFATSNLKLDDHCVFLDRLDASQFAAAMRLCDVFLDNLGWSGCNSTLESLACDLPIVTMPGPLMRSRHSAAILRMIDVTETIAESVEDYVRLAARLAKDGVWRSMIRDKISAGKRLVYRDSAPIAALEEFLEGAVRDATAVDASS